MSAGTEIGDYESAEVEDVHLDLRLDQFLADQIGSLSRSRVKRLIKQGAVSRDGGTIEDPSYKVKPGERYVLSMPEPVEADPKPENIPLSVVYEDDDLIVIDKPAGMVVHPAAGNWNKTLVNALLYHCGTSLSGIGGVLRPGIIHRLDKDTTGLIVAAKNDAAHAGLRRQFDEHTIERAYLAIVWGGPRPLAGTVDLPLARGGGDRQKMVIVRPTETRAGKNAVTHYKVLERYGKSSEPAACLVECRLETGRTHQIRVHMSHIGHPLIGDSTYGRGQRFLRSDAPAEARDAVQAFKRQALHAYVLGFEHPITAERLRFEAKIPKDLADLALFLELL